MESQKEKRPDPGTANKPDKNRDSLEDTQKFCLWFDPETFTPHLDNANDVPAERVNIGGYVPAVIGSKSELQKLLIRIQRKPVLAEKFIKSRPL